MQKTEYVLPQGVRFTKTGLVLPPDLSPQEWATVGAVVAAGQKAMGLWYGDWLKHGRANFDAAFVEATLRQQELPLHGVERFELMAEVLPEHRSEALSSEHFFVAAKRLEDDAERARWLKTAELEGLSPRELQASIRAGRVVRIDEPGRRGGIATPARMRFEFLAWWRELGDGWMRWEAEDFPDVLEEFREILAARQQLQERYEELRFEAAVKASKEDKE